ncbi:uncharacterized protein LOC110824826 [Carica papaya]|uniref:uncharacterized protein LOC110824826 n=1 Tax=Carica papaya TaxID=3649 RepID=UPI000B8CB320|nr:uncharacterized protein LOC110824826 [Carica papaya]
MEGLIPLVYKAIVQYRNGSQGSPSTSYMRLPGDSGRFQTSDFQLFPSNNPPPSTTAATAGAQIMVSTGVQSPVYRFNTRRVIA